MAPNIANRDDLLAVVAIDTWLTLHNGRQARAVPVGSGKYRIIAVDFGHCLGAGNWDAQSLAAQAMPAALHDPNGWVQGVAHGVASAIADRIAAVTQNQLQAVAASIPADWQVSDADRAAVVAFLVARQQPIVQLLRAVDSTAPAQ